MSQGPTSNRLDQFWAEAAGAPLVMLTDFDFTITTVDVGDLITFDHCPPEDEVLDRFQRGEIGTRLYWLNSMAKVDLARAIQLADSVSIDPGFPRFAAYCRERGIPIAVVSDGFTFYIDQVLRREGLDWLPVFANARGANGALQFPFGNPACDRCACCKAGVARRLRQNGARIIYFGDGISDLYAAGHADWVFAKGRLARFMKENGSPYFPLDSFTAAMQVLLPNLERFASGAMEHRSTLTVHANCRFAE